MTPPNFNNLDPARQKVVIQQHFVSRHVERFGVPTEADACDNLVERAWDLANYLVEFAVGVEQEIAEAQEANGGAQEPSEG